MNALAVQVFAPCVLLFAASISYAEGAANSTAVRLFVQSEPLVIAADSESTLNRKAIELLESSSLNSDNERFRGNFPARNVQQDYRDAVGAGEYLLVTLSPERKFFTRGGEVSATEIVIGNRCPGNRNCVFTIDQAGRITSYAKYEGALWLELERIVAQARRKNEDGGR